MNLLWRRRLLLPSFLITVLTSFCHAFPFPPLPSQHSHSCLFPPSLSPFPNSPSLLFAWRPSPFISSHDRPNIQHMVSCVRAKEIISALHLPTPDDHFTWLLHPPHCCLIFYVNRWKTTQGVHKAGSIFPAPFPKDRTRIKQY